MVNPLQSGARLAKLPRARSYLQQNASKDWSLLSTGLGILGSRVACWCLRGNGAVLVRMHLRKVTCS